MGGNSGHRFPASHGSVGEYPSNHAPWTKPPGVRTPETRCSASGANDELNPQLYEAAQKLLHGDEVFSTSQEEEEEEDLNTEEQEGQSLSMVDLCVLV